MVGPRLTLDEMTDEGNWQAYVGPEEALRLLHPPTLQPFPESEDCLQASGCVQLLGPGHLVGVRVRVLDSDAAALFDLDLFSEDLVRDSLMHLLSQPSSSHEFRVATGYVIRGEGQLAYMVEGVDVPKGAASDTTARCYELHAFVLEPAGAPVWLMYRRVGEAPLTLDEYLGIERVMWSITTAGETGEVD